MNRKEFVEIVALIAAFVLLCAWAVIPEDYLYANAYSSGSVSRGSTSGDSTSRNSSSRNSTGRDSTSQNSTSRNSTSQNSTSRNSTSQNSSGRNGGSRRSSGGTRRRALPVVTPRPEPIKTFSDVSADAYYSDAVNWAVENSITAGTSDTTFSPENPCRRKEIVAFLYRMAGSPGVDDSGIPFVDVPEDAYYHDALVWAYANHIIAGTSSITFSPDEACTRGQIVNMLYHLTGQERSAGETVSENQNPFRDVSSAAYYADAVKWAYSSGVTSGTGRTTFSPDRECLRGQAVTFLYRVNQLK